MKVVIFGGTTEGRQLAGYLIQLNKQQKMQNIQVHVCVASEYGAQVLPEDDALKVHVGRLEQADMQEFLQEVQADICVDATHPYAVIVTKNIYQACKVVGVPYVRVRRDMQEEQENADPAMQEEPVNADPDMQMSGTHIGDVDGKRYTDETSDSIYVGDIQAAVDYLKGVTGNILITTGSKELHLYTQIPDYGSRCTARVLPTRSVVEACTELGFTGKHLICMQGPFDLEMNLATLRYADADFMVTKASGKNGGYDEKCEAALAAGVQLVVIGRPKEQVEPVMSLAQTEEYLREKADA
ncbi:MAG: precorrin-6A/cobalt-precorrin-6A reductase [Wujia sp.]|nr:precorrin-6A/cobalt-precorrin-6A reductase [Wujia sp.]MCI6240835.1 precorrin-6A/cobalt-precorrin-6A reductase [Clostridium sp.]MDD7282710.1 precorrin-6A/cobalt-precorrin-6A reductase [Clostridium sp.]MDY3728315.1 precorrin-6A/cobalt-precorrin-6A reductase [Wujia sp.]